MTATDASRQDLVFRHLCRGQVLGMELLFAGYVLAVAVFGLVVHLTVGIQGDIWNPAISLMRWFSVGMGVYLTAVYQPVYVAHGRTRREVAIGSAGFSLVWAAWITVAALIGFAIEAGVFHLLGWSELLLDPHPLGSVTAGAQAFALHAATFLTFTAVGALAGAAFYRDGRLGIVSVPVGLAMIAASEILIADNPITSLPFIDEVVPAIQTEAGQVVMNLLLSAVAMALTWPIVRDIPLRNRSA
jgi:hypothetical protein